MTLRSRLFGAIGITLSVILAVLVAVTLTLEWSRVQRIRGVHETAVEFAASLAASVPYEAYRDTLLLRDGELHDSITSLAVFRVNRHDEPESDPSDEFGEIAADQDVRRRALPLVRQVLETGDGVREGNAVAVLVPRNRGAAASQDARPRVVYLELRPLALDPVTVSRVTFLVIVASGALLLFGVWLIVDRVVARPLRDVVRGAQRVAEGEYGEPVPDSGAQDEIQKVVESFNAMMLELGMLHERMQDRIGDALRRARRTQDSLVIAQRLAATGTLAAGIAHEVNNPLGGMLNAVRALRTKEMRPDRREEYLGLIEDGLTRIQATVAKILRFTPHQVAPQAVDLADVVQPALALVRHRVDREGVELVVGAPEEPAVVFGDFYELQQALLNVIINALDAIAEADRDAPRLEVRLSTDEPGEVRLAVQDNGVGMDPEDVPRAFDLFFTTKEQGKGSGLGLATVHKILDDHGGRVELSPEPGVGMTVTFVLPRLAEPA
jgi:signal transduction histidine kinase